MPSMVARWGRSGEIKYRMKISKLTYTALMLLAIFALSSYALAAPPAAARLLDSAHKLALEAQETDGKLPQGKKFREAIAEYQKAMSKDKDGVYAAKAMLAIGKIYAGVPVDALPSTGAGLKQVYKSKVPGGFPMYREGNLQNYYTARDQFYQIQIKFDSKRPYQELVDNYGSEDAAQLRDIAKQAAVYKTQVEYKADTENRNSPSVLVRTLYKIMDSLVALTGRVSWFSYWFAIILITVFVKVITTPLTKLQFKSMKEMQRLQPLVKDIQEKHKGDQRAIGEKIMSLYKEHGVNPLSGCLPLLIQMPILFTLYYTIRYYEFQFANGSFLWIGWEPIVHKLSVPLMGKPVWLTAHDLSQPDLILLVLYTISMVISQKLSVVDPTQAEQQKMMMIMMPLMFFFLIGYLPSAFVLYWFVYNLLQTWQQYHVIHGSPNVPLPETAPEPAAPTKPTKPSERRRKRR